MTVRLDQGSSNRSGGERACRFRTRFDQAFTSSTLIASRSTESADSIISWSRPRSAALPPEETGPAQSRLPICSIAVACIVLLEL